MISIYKNTELGLEELDNPVNGCWINIINPTSDEVDRVTAWGIPLDFLTYALDVDERPRMEKEDDGTMLVILRIPYFQGLTVDVPYATIPLGVILTGQYFVSVCRRPTDILQEFASGRMRNFSTGKRNRFLLRLLLSTANKYLTYLREINKTVDNLEDKLQASMRNKEVFDLLKYQKSLVYFTTALKSNGLMLERLQRSQFFHTYPDDEDLLEDVITENAQAMEMVNISNNILTSMMDAFGSIISNNMNVVMKFLASMTIVLSLPTIVTSFFGMNVNLPFSEHPQAYLIVIGIFTLLSLLVTIIFVRRDWF
ncbi:MAG TPA: magnesium transporter CorA family protein [Anaerolineaceae bacterium]|nr:magnesium transporter CorA family protein [Anaerolineaceae bacterium]HPN50510.1 magnesium transporter CorA family protein [Anaerolineaceae bacterium]